MGPEARRMTKGVMGAVMIKTVDKCRNSF